MSKYPSYEFSLPSVLMVVAMFHSIPGLRNIHIIVMGTTGLRGISKIKALGSVARHVSEEAECPVLLTR